MEYLPARQDGEREGVDGSKPSQELREMGTEGWDDPGQIRLLERGYSFRLREALRL